MPRDVHLLITDGGGLIYLPPGQHGRTPRYEIVGVPDHVDVNEVIRQARKVVVFPVGQPVSRFAWGRLTDVEQGRIIRLDKEN